MNNVFYFDISKVYVCLIAGLIFVWILFMKDKLLFPGWLNVFFGFAFIHILITHGLIFRDEFTFVDPKIVFSNSDPHVLAENYERTEAIGITILRYFIFMISGYVICDIIQTKRQLFYFILAYTAGLSIVAFISVFSLGVSMESRVAGGVADPNCFGFSGSMLTVLVSIFITDRNLRPYQRGILIYGFILGSGVVLVSASRGALLSVIIGLMVTLMNAKVPFKKVAALAALIIAVAMMIQIHAASSQEESAIFDGDRYSIDGALSDHGAGRSDIWYDYLQPSVLKKCFLTGVGFGRSIDAINDTYTYMLKAPHNNYLVVFVDYGIIGISLFLIGLVQTWASIRMSALRGLYSMWLTSGFFLGTFELRETWIILGIICCRAARAPASEMEKGALC
jgi:hypothetical protein